ncbi:hypothetical protein [Microbulbifer litoralis]|uniref:hypothetical protein n=1 Tax=Microbulbifer litoralis TaxID=2933965 RepID=UPI002028C4ED|nr:hypothetical protein [Microbulbifer sp. GX H0434]
MKSKLAIVPILVGLLGGCAGWDGFWGDLKGTPDGYTRRDVPLSELQAFPRHCLAGDTEVMALADCPMGYAACYQLDTGNWCSDSRAEICPLSAEPLVVDSDCPWKGDCRVYYTNLRCRSTADIRG